MNQYQIKAWLYKVIHSRFIDKIRKDSRLSEMDDDYEMVDEDTITGNIDNLEIIEIMNKLVENQRKAIYLKFYRGYDSHEIAQKMQANSSTVRSWIMRGLNNMKDELDYE